MPIIEQMLTGEISMREFIAALDSDKHLQKAVFDLVPQEARYNPDHPLWKGFSYDSIKKHDFDLYRLLLTRMDFDGTIGDNLNIFAYIHYFYVYQHPEIKATEQYDKAHSLYLTVIRDCFDGPEVYHVVEEIINNALALPTKKQQIAYAKSEIASKFHVADKCIPRWIQGPEWPMGINSPMVFLSRQRKGEFVNYNFEDYDTKEQRTVVQFF